MVLHELGLVTAEVRTVFRLGGRARGRFATPADFALTR